MAREQLITSPQEVVYLAPISLKNDATPFAKQIQRIQMGGLRQLLGPKLLNLMVADLVTDTWDLNQAYIVGDAIVDGGFGWVCIADNTGETPPALPDDPNDFWEYQAQFQTERFRTLWDKGLNCLVSALVTNAAIPFIATQIGAAGVFDAYPQGSQSTGQSGAAKMQDNCTSAAKEYRDNLFAWLTYDAGAGEPIHDYPEWEQFWTWRAPVTNGILLNGPGSPSTFWQWRGWMGASFPWFTW